MIPNGSLRLAEAPHHAPTSRPSLPMSDPSPVRGGGRAAILLGDTLPRGGGRDLRPRFGPGEYRVLREPSAAAARGTLLPVPFGAGREGQGRAPRGQPRGAAQGWRERTGDRPGAAGTEPAHRGRPVLE